MKTKKDRNTDNECIKIRYKALKSGNKSVYLDCYLNGKRSYEFLKLYLVPEVDEETKLANQETLKQAERLKNERLQELNTEDTAKNEVTNEEVDDQLGNTEDNTAPTINSSLVENRDFVTRDGLLLMDALRIYEVCAEQRKCSSTLKIVKSTMDAVIAYKGADVLLHEVDKAYCMGFITYLKTSCVNKRGAKITNNTAEAFMHTISASLNMMVRIGFMRRNPFDLIEPNDKIIRETAPSTVLDDQELLDLIATPCLVARQPEVRKAFLLSCFCGITLKEVKSLTWGQVVKKDDKMVIDIPSKSITYLLSEEALKWLPKRKDAKNGDLVYQTLPSDTRIFGIVHEWANVAGIKKNVTFNSARQTFTTRLLKSCKDEYEVSERLGIRKVPAGLKQASKKMKEKTSSTSFENVALSKLDDIFE